MKTLTHTEAPWPPYSALRVAVNQDGTARLNRDDYEHAMKCVNLHDELVALLHRASCYFKEAGTLGPGVPPFVPNMKDPETKLSHEIQELLSKATA